MLRRRKWRTAWSTLTVAEAARPARLVGGLRRGATRLRSPCLYSLCLEAVADRFDRGDPAPDVAELGAEPPDVHVDRARLDLVRARVAPHAVEEVLAGEDAAGGLEQRREEVELLRREVERPAAECHGVALRVQRERSRRQDARLGSRPGAAQDGAHPRDQ